MEDKTKVAKINISLKPQLLEKIDQFADELGINRSAFICLCCSNYINAQEGMARIKDLMSIMNELKAKNAPLSDDELKKLDDVDRMINLLEEVN